MKHIWHEDRGYRLAAIRNQAVERSSADYIVQIDGDLILHKDFIADHEANAREGYFLSGGRSYLNAKVTSQLLEGTRSRIDAFTPGLRKRLYAVRCGMLSRSMIRHKADTFRYGVGANLSYWREDVLRINGYDESFTGWGREDTEFMYRLMASGIKKRSLRFNAVCFHLHHNSRQDTGVIDRNDRILEESISSGSYVCLNGIRKPEEQPR